MTNNELPVSYESVLTDLKAKRDALDDAIDIIERLMSSGAAGVVGSPSASQSKAAEASAEVRSDSFFGLSIPDAARKFLKMSKAPKSGKEIADALDRGGLTHSSADFGNTVGSVLNRLDKSGSDIVRVGRGQYGLTEWYPGMKRKRNAKESDEPNEL